jgi:hypothetical protein
MQRHKPSCDELVVNISQSRPAVPLTSSSVMATGNEVAAAPPDELCASRWRSNHGTDEPPCSWHEPMECELSC